MHYFDGKKIRNEILKSLKKEINFYSLKPVLSVIWVGDDFATARYIEAKQRASEKVGVHFDLIKYSRNVSEDEVIKKIEKLNDREYVDGVMIQIPVPSRLNMNRLIAKISPRKDVDALRYCLGLDCKFRPPVVKSIFEAIKHSGIKLNENKIAVIGRGFLVGTPMIRMLDALGSDLRIADSKTPYLATITKDADVIISATGISNIIKANMVKEGSVLIDAGTTEVGGKLTGDIDQRAYQKAKYYTPVPGGIGPVTVAMLLKNVVWATKKD